MPRKARSSQGVSLSRAVRHLDLRDDSSFYFIDFCVLVVKIRVRRSDGIFVSFSYLLIRRCVSLRILVCVFIRFPPYILT